MESLTPIPLHERFGLRVFLFNAILLFAIIAPTAIIKDMDYKDLVDRNNFHIALFDDCAERMRGAPRGDWPAIIESYPGVLYQQRICVFDIDKELIYDSGIMKELMGRSTFRLLLPDPYIDWAEQNRQFDPSVYIAFLQGIDVENLDPRQSYVATRSVRYEAGTDRIILTGRLVRSAEGEERIVTMSHSLVDILINNRAIKERFLIIYIIVILLCLLLTILLSRSVTSPLKQLYDYSREIIASKRREDGLRALPERGEIGGICQALRGLIEQEKRQSESFMRFSSDIVHELKTPLTAIRSGLEIYSESADEEEKTEILARVNRRIQHMESLMDEIHFLGSLESSREDEGCRDIAHSLEEALYGFREYEIKIETAADVEKYRLPISCEKVQQILTNLVKNAVSFSPGKGSVAVSAAGEESRLVIRVSDNGKGIAKEVFPRIKDRFFTFRPNAEEKHSGLGLSIVDAILRGCGGDMEYRNRMEGGAEFICRIPVEDT